uniref:RWD domain-containing protein n=1 Tax=Arion vulgaris TaxID=1028688 RepID=A0A0B6ZR41_9EUPU
MSENDNIARQSDEVEALSAIYGDEWCIVDASSQIYCICITDIKEAPKWTLNLQVHMPPDYPLQSPPEYQINAAWLRGLERTNLENKLSQIYCENIGEDLIFLWVEAVREFLQDKSDRDMVQNNNSAIGRIVVQSVETEEDEDGFDPSVLGDLSYLTIDHRQQSSQSVSCPEIFHGETLTDRRSTFQAHLAHVTDKTQIQTVMNKLLENKKIANATHNMFAYRILTDSGVVYQGCDDDGETHAGSRMLHLLQIMDADNVIVIVSRWYGGIHLGSDRFKHINNCTRLILETNGFQRDKDEKRGLKSGKKAR